MKDDNKLGDWVTSKTHDISVRLHNGTAYVYHPWDAQKPRWTLNRNDEGHWPQPTSEQGAEAIRLIEFVGSIKHDHSI